MTKLLYNPVTDTISRYPRADDDPVMGLDPALLVMDEVIADKPTIDPATRYLERETVIDTTALTITRGWRVVDRPPAPPEPKWQQFQVALLTDPGVHDMMMIVKDSYPGLISAWSVGLGQAASGQGAESFMTAWGLARQLPNPATGDPLLGAALISSIAAMATAADLPGEFITGLNAA